MFLEALRNKQYAFISLKLSLHISTRVNWKLKKKHFGSVCQAWKFRWVFFITFFSECHSLCQEGVISFYLTKCIWILSLYLNLCTSVDSNDASSWNCIFFKAVYSDLPLIAKTWVQNFSNFCLVLFFNTSPK